MIGNLRIVHGAVMVFDVVATLGDVAITNLGGGSDSTLGDVGRSGGKLSWPDIIVESWQIAARCLSLVLAIVGIICPSCSKRPAAASKVLSCSDETGTWQNAGSSCHMSAKRNTKLTRCRNKDNGSGCWPGQRRNRQLRAAPRRLLLQDCCKPVLFLERGKGHFVEIKRPVKLLVG